MVELRSKLKIIYNNFGKKIQTKKLNEECFEFIEAVREYQYHGNKQYMEEEIADIYVLLKQFELSYKLNKRNINKNIKSKIDRTLERIKNDYYQGGIK